MPELLSEYFPIAVFFAIAVGLAIAMVSASLLLGNQRPDDEKMAAYECGFDAFDDSRRQFDVRFYLVAILFIIFDLEVENDEEDRDKIKPHIELSARIIKCVKAAFVSCHLFVVGPLVAQKQRRAHHRYGEAHGDRKENRNRKIFRQKLRHQVLRSL